MSLYPPERGTGPFRSRLRLLLPGARKVAADMPPEDDIQRLWREADAATVAFQRALAAAPEGTDLKSLPEYAAWKATARAFTEAAEASLGW